MSYGISASRAVGKQWGLLTAGEIRALFALTVLVRAGVLTREGTLRPLRETTSGFIAQQVTELRTLPRRQAVLFHHLAYCHQLLHCRSFLFAQVCQ